jgi:hypothetical protein
VLGLELVLV